MARKKKTSPLEDMMDLVALLPWWGGVAIAIVGYVVLHRMAAPVKVGAVQPGQVSQLMTASIITGLATVGQYLVPLVGLAGAAMSVVRRKQRAALISSVTQSQSANALDGMSWREFEMLVGEAYALQGYRVTETGGGGAAALYGCREIRPARCKAAVDPLCANHRGDDSPTRRPRSGARSTTTPTDQRDRAAGRPARHRRAPPGCAATHPAWHATSQDPRGYSRTAPAREKRRGRSAPASEIPAGPARSSQEAG